MLTTAVTADVDDMLRQLEWASTINAEEENGVAGYARHTHTHTDTHTHTKHACSIASVIALLISVAFSAVDSTCQAWSSFSHSPVLGRCT